MSEGFRRQRDLCYNKATMDMYKLHSPAGCEIIKIACTGDDV